MVNKKKAYPKKTTTIKKKTAKFNKADIEKLANDKPAVYQTKDSKGNVNYVGVAKRGRVPARVKEHLPGTKEAIKDAKTVKIRQYPSIDKARKSEARLIKRLKPSGNKKGKQK